MAFTQHQQQDQSHPSDIYPDSDHQGSSNLPSRIFSRIRNLAANFGHSSGMTRGDSRDSTLPPGSSKSANKDLKKSTIPSHYHERDEIISDLRRQLITKDREIAFLMSELDKYQSVFNQKSSGLVSGSQRGTITEFGSLEMEADGPRKRGIGISAEPRALKVNEIEHPTHYPKTSK
ncbi:unnamed protein product [Rodentolepis nana]|uniref:cGMP-dependent protein kinase N-terminal coiled-coil domain-containing protein n=1 Tax=Rodentolepis nana TaxID=102285 RepID=A0A0R3TD72_RODNA|nr:unnamed protein product [Rodentolepis nana]